MLRAGLKVADLRGGVGDGGDLDDRAERREWRHLRATAECGGCTSACRGDRRGLAWMCSVVVAS